MNKKTIVATGTSASLQDAVAHHQAGRLADAQAIYRALLEADPDHFAALHFSGVIARQLGDPRQGIEWIDRALATLQRHHITPGLAHASAYCNLAGCWIDCGDAAIAIDNLQRAIALNPNYAIAHNNLGNALKIQGKYNEAMQSYSQALRCSPNNPEAHYNLGLVLYLTAQYPAALQQFDLALALRPGYANALCARALVWLALNQPERSVEDCDRAIALQPSDAEAFFNRGIAYSRLQQFELAADSYATAIARRPGFAKAWFHRAQALQQSSRPDDAITAYMEAGSCGYDSAQVNFALAALGAAQAPSAAPPSYVRDLFDQYADHFDAHLLGKLHYQVPQLIADCLRRYHPGRFMETLDLGCGTGLCALALKPQLQALTGIDLSQRMLDQAARCGLYNQLHCADLTAFLSTTAARYDLVVAGDVLVYIGALEPILTGVNLVLQPAGLFCFSVEFADTSDDVTDYALGSSQRYRHTEPYLRRTLAQCGLELLTLEHHIGRTEHQHNTDTLIILTRKVTRAGPE